MNHPVLAFATVAAMTAIASGNEFLCDIPTAGCANGMFNQVTCSCDCIPPFCPDALGNCLVSGTCEDPWTNCTRGKNCPWWSNTLKAESCTTGPKVPDGMWDIFTSEEICCKANFPYSEYCAPDSTPPTKHPTIALLEDDDYDIVSIQFIASDLPDNIPINAIQKEMEAVLKRIILRLSEKIDGMKVTKVEAAKQNVNLRRQLRERGLAKEVTLYFHVYVIRNDDKKFGPYIIHEIRDSYDEVLTQIQSFSDTKYLIGNHDINFCTLDHGEYDLCVIDEVITQAPSPAPAPAPEPAAAQSSAVVQPDTASGGLTGWAIALIVTLVLSVVCCGGYAIAVMCFGVENFFKDPEDAKGENFQNNIYMDERFGPTDSRKRLAIMDSKSQMSRKQLTLDSRMQWTLRGQNSNQHSQIHGGSRVYPDSQSGVQVVCSNPEYPSFDDTEFTINTYSTNRRKARDPTMFISGQDSRPDPGTIYSQGFTYDGCSSRRYYSNEPALKPKREPTMYVDGKVSAIDPVISQEPDPTLYDEGHQSTIARNIYSSYHYEIEPIDDDVEYIRSCQDRKSFRSQATYSRDGHAILGGTSLRSQEKSARSANNLMKSKSSQRTNKQHLDSFQTSQSTSPDAETTFSKHSSHKSKSSKNTTPRSGVFTG